MKDTLRSATDAEQRIFVRVAGASAALLAAGFKPESVVLSSDLFGDEADHFEVLLGLPVVLDPTAPIGHISIAVAAKEPK